MIFFARIRLVFRERNSISSFAMDDESQFAAELQALRTLCDEAAPREERQRLIHSLNQLIFVEPEHQVVFESVQALFLRGPVSMAQLRVHLNNRGFPDTDVEKYFQSARGGDTRRQNTGIVTP
jgi:hypothetical protein